MLILRPEQVLALAEARIACEEEQVFVERLAQWARSAYWEQMRGRTEGEIQAAIRTILSRGLRYGIEREGHHRDFVEFELIHGPFFEEKSQYIRDLLIDATIPSGAKLALIRRYLEE